jgi:hypothetical protein
LAGDGSFIGDEFLVIAGNHDNRQQNLAYNPHRNEYMVVWNDRRNENDVPNIDIFAVRKKNDGTLIGESFPLCTAPNDQAYCTIAYDTVKREYLAVWNDFRDSEISTNLFGLFPFIGTLGKNVVYDPGTVYGIWLNDEGAKIGSEFILCKESQGKQMLAMAKYFQTSEVSGNFFVAWSDMRYEGNGRDIFGTIFESRLQLLCPATSLLGDDDPRLDTLRRFRDEKLAANPLGCKIIELYYDRSPVIIDMCEKSPAVKWFFKNMLERMIPVIEVML